MPETCVVIGCQTKGHLLKKGSYLIPKDLGKSIISTSHHPDRIKLSEIRHKLWLDAIRRKDLWNDEKFNENRNVCYRHFHSGKPAKLLEPYDIDWVPTLNMGYVESKEKTKQRKELALQNAPKFSMNKTFPPPDQSEAVYLQNSNTFDTEDSLTDEVTIYECGFCSKSFKTVKGINEHIINAHGDWRSYKQGGAVHIPRSPKEKLLALLRILHKFEWCDCRVCVQICDTFLRHARDAHVIIDSQQLNPKPNFQPANENKDDFEDAVDENTEEYAEDFLWPEENKEPPSKKNREPEPESPENISAPVKKVLFKMRKKGHFKIYECIVCQSKLESHAQMLDHFRMHLSNDDLPNDDAIDATTTPVVVDDDDSSLKKRAAVEYQCSVCAHISESREKIQKCVESHESSDGPNESSGLVWDTKIAENEHQTIEIETVEAVNAEDHLETIAMDYEYSVDVAHESIDDEDTYYHCRSCHKYYDIREEFQAHLAELHHENDVISDEYVVGVKKRIVCASCRTDNGESFLFNTYEEAMAHRRENHSYPYTKSNTQKMLRYMINADKSEVQVTGDLQYFQLNCIIEEYQCPCGKIYGVRNKALKCVNRHVGIRRYKCEKINATTGNVCGHGFYIPDDLIQHINKIHETEVDPDDTSTIICYICGKLCNSDNLNYHLRSYHSTTKSDPITCPTCGKLFKSQNSLRSHNDNVHEKIKRHQCTVCFKRFIYKSAAEKCEALHTGQRSVKCKNCPHVFYTVMDMKAHRNKHHPRVPKLTCEQCSSVFDSVKELRNHQCQVQIDNNILLVKDDHQDSDGSEV